MSVATLCGCSWLDAPTPRAQLLADEQQRSPWVSSASLRSLGCPRAMRVHCRESDRLQATLVQLDIPSQHGNFFLGRERSAT